MKGTKEWTQEQKERARALLTKYSFLFAMDNLDLGKTDLVKHHIELTNYTPIKDRYRRIPPQQYEEVQKHLKEILDIGAIRCSNSPWASPVVLVRKKDGSLRFCIDLRKLNARTVKDAYSIPHIEDALGQFKWCLHLYLSRLKKWILASRIGRRKYPPDCIHSGTLRLL